MPSFSPLSPADIAATEAAQQIRFDALIEAAQHHGEDSDPDHEVGDLQDHLRAMWSILTAEQREHFLSRPDVIDTYETGARGI